MSKATYLLDGVWLSEKQYLAIPEKEYEREVKRRKKIKFKVN